MTNLQLRHYNFEQNIELSDEYINVLIIEDVKQYSRYVSEFYRQMCDGDGEFMLFSAGKEISLSKSILPVYNVFEDIMTDKRLVSAIYKKMEIIVQQADCQEKYYKMQGEIYDYLTYLIEYSDLPLEVKELSGVSSLFKAFDMRLYTDYSSILEKLTDYITLVARLDFAKIIAFFGLQNVLDKCELAQFYQHCLYEKVVILDVENIDREIRLTNEHITILDKDQCEILIFN